MRNSSHVPETSFRSAKPTRCNGWAVRAGASFVKGVLTLLSFLLPALSCSIACAHGSNVLEPAEASGRHTGQHAHVAAHAGGGADASADEFEELHEQIEELQDRLTAHDERVRVTDIVGGIGYIVGITGAAYYYLGARRRHAGGNGKQSLPPSSV
jgi:hypothetical protein